MISQFTPEQIDAAIEAEVDFWAHGFDEDEERYKEQRRAFHRANLNAGRLGSLKRFLGVFPVLSYRLEEALHELKKLARKAERYGTPSISWTVGETYQEKQKNADGKTISVSYNDLVFSALDAPRVGDYTFLAKAELTEGGAIIDVVPGQELPEGSRKRIETGACEHCNNLRWRKEVFLVRDPAGKVVQVGRTCLRDYMGTDTPASIAARFRWLRELESFSEEWGGRVSREDQALELLAVTATAIRLWGWVPKSAPESAGEPTAFRVGCWYFVDAKDKAGKKDAEDLKSNISEDDWKTAQEVMDWVAGEESGDSDFIQNLRAILGAGAVKPKRRGYACAAVAAYQRHMGRLEQQRLERENAAESQWVGTVGERLKSLKLKCLSVRGISSGYQGTTKLYKLQDEKGNRFVWFSSGSASFAPGEELTLDATVKSHGQYEGVKETQLTRGKVA